MTYEDPFASAPTQDEAQQAPDAEAPAASVTVSETKPAAVAPPGDGKVVLTFKGGTGFDAPWIVVHADSIEDAYELMTTKAGLLAQVMERVQRAAKHFAGQGTSSAPAGNGGGQQQSRAPQAAQQAPNGEERFCQHGKMEYKTGVSKKSGKPYALFSCTAPRDQQCQSQWPSK